MHLTYHPTERRALRATVARLLAVIGGASMLAGCYTNQEVAIPAAFDYRLRHPIAIKEGPSTTELLIGTNRGGLTAEQRAGVLGCARRLRRQATGGVIIELPAGTRNEIAAANAVHEVRAILEGAG